MKTTLLRSCPSGCRLLALLLLVYLPGWAQPAAAPEPIRSLRELPLPKELRLPSRPAPQAVLAPYEQFTGGSLTDFQGNGLSFTAAPASSWTFPGSQARTAAVTTPTGTTYAPTQLAELVSPPIRLDTTLSDRSRALMGFALYFDERYALETGHDFGSVYLQVEQADQSWSEWSLLSQRTGQSPGSDTRITYLSLRDPALWHKRVRVKFSLQSDCATQYQGWTLDNVTFRQIVTTPQIRTALLPLAPPVAAPPGVPIPRYPLGGFPLRDPINGIDRLFKPALERLLEHPCRLDVTFVVNGAFTFGQDLPQLVHNNLDQLAELLQSARQTSCKRVRVLVVGGRQAQAPAGRPYNYFLIGAGGPDAPASNAHLNLRGTDLTSLREDVLARVAGRPGQNTAPPQNGAAILQHYLQTGYGTTPEPGVKRVVVVLNNSDAFDDPLYNLANGRPRVTAEVLQAQLQATGVTLLVNSPPQLNPPYSLSLRGPLRATAAQNYQDRDPKYLLLDLAAATACSAQDEACDDEDDVIRLVSVDFQGANNHPMQKQAARKEDSWQDDTYGEAGTLPIDYPEWQASEQQGPPAVNDPVAQTWQTPARMAVQLRVGRTAAKRGTVTVYRDGAVVASKVVSLQAGLNTIADWTWEQNVSDVTGEKQVNLAWRFTPEGGAEQFLASTNHTFFILLDKLVLTGEAKYVGRTAKRMQFVANAIANICCNRQNAQEPGVDETDSSPIIILTLPPKKEAVFKAFEYFQARNINFDPNCDGCFVGRSRWILLDGVTNGYGDCGALAELMKITLMMGGVEAQHKYLFATTKNDLSFVKDASEGCPTDLIEKRDFVINGVTKELRLMYLNGGDPGVNLKESVTSAEGYLIAPAIGIWDNPVDVLSNFICPNTVESGNYQVWAEDIGNSRSMFYEIPGHYPEPFPFDCSKVTSFHYKGQGLVKRKTKTRRPTTSAPRAGTSAAVAGTRAATQAAATTLEVHPNPFQDEFSVTYALPQADEVSVLLQPMDGSQALPLLPPRKQTAGRQQLTLRSGGVATGLYLLIVRGQHGFELRQKLVKMP